MLLWRLALIRAICYTGDLSGFSAVLLLVVVVVAAAANVALEDGPYKGNFYTGDLSGFCSSSSCCCCCC